MQRALVFITLSALILSTAFSAPTRKSSNSRKAEGQRKTPKLEKGHHDADLEAQLRDQTSTAQKNSVSSGTRDTKADDVKPDSAEPIVVELDGIADSNMDVKIALKDFFRKLKEHPEVVEELIDKESARLLQEASDGGKYFPVKLSDTIMEDSQEPSVDKIQKSVSEPLKMRPDDDEAKWTPPAEKFIKHDNPDIAVPYGTRLSDDDLENAINRPLTPKDIAQKAPMTSQNQVISNEIPVLQQRPLEERVLTGYFPVDQAPQQEKDAITDSKQMTNPAALDLDKIEQYSEAHPFMNPLPYFPKNQLQNYNAKSDNKGNSEDHKSAEPIGQNFEKASSNTVVRPDSIETNGVKPVAEDNTLNDKEPVPDAAAADKGEILEVPSAAGVASGVQPKLRTQDSISQNDGNEKENVPKSDKAGTVNQYDPEKDLEELVPYYYYYYYEEPASESSNGNQQGETSSEQKTQDSQDDAKIHDGKEPVQMAGMSQTDDVVMTGSKEQTFKEDATDDRAAEDKHEGNGKNDAVKAGSEGEVTSEKIFDPRETDNGNTNNEDNDEKNISEGNQESAQNQDEKEENPKESNLLDIGNSRRSKEDENLKAALTKSLGSARMIGVNTKYMADQTSEDELRALGSSKTSRSVGIM